MICCGVAMKRMGMLGCEEVEGANCEYRDSDTDWERWIECDMLCVLRAGN
jgi:hypothetical protein